MQARSYTEWIAAWLFFCVCLFWFYPDLFLMRLTPMGADTWTLKDPTVSWSAFMPAFREFRYQLLEHGNLLWSSLRGMGQPLLGNTLQGAPLFPLNLALIPLSDWWYWSVMPLLRVSLIALACYLIARKVFSLTVTASLTFALLAGFNLNIMRWLNHPWTNGLLAGVWYFYFLTLCTAKTTKPVRTGAAIGLIVCIFAMLNNGFPEASALAALMVLLLYPAYLISCWQSLEFGKTIAVLSLCHIVGFALSIAPLLALLEYILFSETMDLRGQFSSGSFSKEQYLPYILAQLTLFYPTAKQMELLAFNSGLIGSLFTSLGLVSVFFHPQSSKTHRIFAVAFMLGMMLFIAKIFGFSSLLNTIFAATPVLAHSHFAGYFSPLLFFGLAFFAAIGVQTSVLHPPTRRGMQICQLLIIVFTTALLILLCGYSVEYFTHASQQNFWRAQLTSKGFIHLQLFLALALLLVVFQISRLIKSDFKWLSYPLTLATMVVALIVFELQATLPDNFDSKQRRSYHRSAEQYDDLQNAMQRAPVERHELRGRNSNGDFVGQGLATADNGVSAILPPDLRRLRLSHFRTKFGGYTNLERPRTPWSWRALSANFQLADVTPPASPDWSQYTEDLESRRRVIRWSEEPHAVTQPLYLSGEVFTVRSLPGPVDVWIHIENEYTNLWIPANLSSQEFVRVRPKVIRKRSHWRLFLSPEWLKGEQFSLTVRQVDLRANSYSDTPPQKLVLDYDHPNAIADQAKQLLGQSSDQSTLYYYDTAALPRAYVASVCEFRNDVKSQWQYFHQSDAVMLGGVIMQAEQPTSTDWCESYSGNFRRVTIKEGQGTLMKLDKVIGPALIVVNDLYYPGWRAIDTLNDQPLSIVKANTAVRAVYLPEARPYQIEMSYQPKWLWMVWPGFLLAVAGLALLSFLLRRWRLN